MDLSDWRYPALCAVIAYGIGSIPFGWVVARLVKGIDIREHGSRNIGATNVGRVCGWGWFVVVILLDGVKGFGPAWAAGTPPFLEAWYGEGKIRLLQIAQSAEITRAAGLAMSAAASGALAGHMWPLYLRFKGGKGVATGLGVFLALNPIAVGIAFAVWLAVVGMSRYVSLGSILAALVLPPAHVFTDAHALGVRWPVTAFTVVAAALVVVKHRENIKRLRAGTERKIGQKENVTPS